MNKVTGWLLTVAALVVFGLSFFHASWLAATPSGGPKLVAAKGVVPAMDPQGCVATANLGANAAVYGHDVTSLQAAAGTMADALAVPVAAKGDALQVASQFERKCAADKAQAPSDASVVLAAITKPVLFWKVKGAESGNALAAKLPAGDKRHVALGDAAAVKAIKAAKPDAQAFDIATARQCASDYKLSGLWGSMPATCKDGAMLLTLDDLGLTLWGWPNRLIARAADANVTLIVAESVEGDAIKGLSDVTQYGDIAGSYNGYIWVDNIAELGPALRR
jgi:glycerophosphoryl diester phosphodiesterase